MELILLDLAIIIIAAAGIGLIAKFLKQPAVLAYIVGGILIGPFGFKLIQNTEFVKTLGELGIALLLFVVGLELSIDRIKKVGIKAAVIGGIGVGVVSLLGFATSISFGFSSVESLYIGLILAFSSTLVVIKLLSDKRALNTLHGRIMLGILLVQDVVVIVALTLLVEADGVSNLAKTGLMGAALLIGAFLSTKYLLPLFFKKIAESQELLFLFSLAWCFSFAAVSSFMGFSIAIGAFIAGVALANFPYNIEIIGRVKPIRDFFVTIFFVAIGIQIIPTISKSLYLPIAIFFILALLIKPIIIAFLVSLSQYTRKTAFFTGFGLAQTSEFSIILAMQGVASNQIPNNILSIAIILTAGTMLVSTYLIKYNKTLYNLFGHIILFFNKKMEHNISNIKGAPKDHIVVLGADRAGRKIVSSLKALKKKFIVVDYNPDVIQGLMSRGINCICGDAEDPEIIEKANIYEAKIIISTLPDTSTDEVVIQKVKRKNKKIMFFGISSNAENALRLYEAGADYIILPSLLAGEKLTDIIKNFNTRRVVDVLRLRQIVELEKIRNYELFEKHVPEMLKFRNKLE